MLICICFGGGKVLLTDRDSLLPLLRLLGEEGRKYTSYGYVGRVFCRFNSLAYMGAQMNSHVGSWPPIGTHDHGFHKIQDATKVCPKQFLGGVRSDAFVSHTQRSSMVGTFPMVVVGGGLQCPAEIWAPPDSHRCFHKRPSLAMIKRLTYA